MDKGTKGRVIHAWIGSNFSVSIGNTATRLSLIAQSAKMIDNQFRMLCEYEVIIEGRAHGHGGRWRFSALFFGRLFMRVKYLFQTNERLGDADTFPAKRTWICTIPMRGCAKGITNKEKNKKFPLLVGLTRGIMYSTAGILITTAYVKQPRPRKDGALCLRGNQSRSGFVTLRCSRSVSSRSTAWIESGRLTASIRGKRASTSW